MAVDHFNSTNPVSLINAASKLSSSIGKGELQVFLLPIYHVLSRVVAVNPVLLTSNGTIVLVAAAKMPTQFVSSVALRSGKL